MTTGALVAYVTALSPSPAFPLTTWPITFNLYTNGARVDVYVNGELVMTDDVTTRLWYGSRVVIVNGFDPYAVEFGPGFAWTYKLSKFAAPLGTAKVEVVPSS